MNTQPIGIFDSGIGGTSIWKEINMLLPNENTIYLADSANAPYGLKGKEAIIKLSIKNTDYLITDIALECGFNSHSHLTNKFRQMTGVTPKAFRST